MPVVSAVRVAGDHRAVGAPPHGAGGDLIGAWQHPCLDHSGYIRVAGSGCGEDRVGLLLVDRPFRQGGKGAGQSVPERLGGGEHRLRRRLRAGQRQRNLGGEEFMRGRVVRGQLGDVGVLRGLQVGDQPGAGLQGTQHRFGPPRLVAQQIAATDPGREPPGAGGQGRGQRRPWCSRRRAGHASSRVRSPRRRTPGRRSHRRAAPGLRRRPARGSESASRGAQRRGPPEVGCPAAPA